MLRKGEEKFEVVLEKDVVEEIAKLPRNHSVKILYNIRKSCFLNDPILFKKLDAEIWEFRTLYASYHYRLLAVWDNSKKYPTVHVLTFFIKKSKKTPLNQIEKAKERWQRIVKERK